MSEITALTLSDEARPEIQVRMPTFKDGMRFVGALAAGDATEALDALDREFNQAAFVLLLKNALRNPGVQDEILAVLSDLWVYEPDEDVLKAEQPPETWEYDPPASIVEKGRLIGRDEQWRSLSMRQKKRLVKRLDLEQLDLDLIGEFAKAFQRLPYIADFLASRGQSTPEEAGTSSTESPEDTDGTTPESKPSTAPVSPES